MLFLIGLHKLGSSEILYLLIFLNYSVETITIGDKRIGIRTSVLEEKATACNMLCCYADELKEGFYPWIEQLFKGINPCKSIKVTNFPYYPMELIWV